MGNACAAAPSGAAACPLPQDAMRPNQKTRQVHVGRRARLAAALPWWCSPCSTPRPMTRQANLAQIQQLADAGCEVVRMAIPRRSCLDTFQAVCEESPLPVVADVHFDATIAIEAARRGAAKLRINPGNIGGLAKTDAVLDAAGAGGHSHPHRRERRLARPGAGRTRRPYASREAGRLRAPSTCEYCEGRGFHDLVVSAKAHDVHDHGAHVPPAGTRDPAYPAAYRRHRGGHARSKASSKAPPAWASCSSRASATPCASRSPTTRSRKCAPAGRCSARSTCAAATPS